MYNRYRGNSGRRERVPEPGDFSPPPPRPAAPPPPGPEPQSPDAGLFSRGLGALLRRLSPGALETEDLLILAVLWLLYRESGDREFLLMLGLYLIV